MRAIHSEMMHPNLYDCLSSTPISSHVYSKLEVSILKEQLVACGTPRRATVVTVVQRRREAFVPLSPKSMERRQWKDPIPRNVAA